MQDLRDEQWQIAFHSVRVDYLSVSDQVVKQCSNKSDEELRFAHILFEQLPSLPSGNLMPSDRPDILVHRSDGNIGIEVTKLHHKAASQSLKRQESEQQALVNQALKIFETKSNAWLHVSVHFGSYTQFNKRNRKQFSEAIANLVLANTPNQDGPVFLENHWSDPQDFPYEISSIGIYRLPAQKRNHWTIPSTGFVQENFIPELQDIMSNKGNLLQDYQQCAEYWLLIVAQNNSASTFFDPSAATLGHKYTSQFNRVFLLEGFHRRVSELELNR